MVKFVYRRQRVLRRLGLPIRKKAYEILLTFYNRTLSLDVTRIPVLNELKGEYLNQVRNDAPGVDVEIDHLFPRVSLQAGAVKHLTYGKVSLCDPSCTLMLPALARELGPGKVSSVTGYTTNRWHALLSYLGCLDVVGQENIHVELGDAFEIVESETITGKPYQEADVVITSLERVRWKNIKTREHVLSFLDSCGYKVDNASYLATRFFLADYLLADGGVLCLKFPTLSFYNNAERGVLKFLEMGYDKRAVIGSDEVILIAKKEDPRGRYYAGDVPAAVAKKMIKKIRSVEPVGEHVPVKGWNPASYVLVGNLASRISRIVKEAGDLLVPLSMIYDEPPVKHPISLPAPTVGFFIPNYHWRVAAVDEDVLKASCTAYRASVKIPREHLLEVFLRPGKDLVVGPTHYAIIFGDDLTPDEFQYIMHWDRREKWWKAYAREIEKEVWSKVHLPIIYRSNGRGTCFYSNVKLPPVHNMYRFMTGNELEDRVFFNWYNTLLVRAMLVVNGRMIKRGVHEMKMNDYLELPVPDITRMGKGEKEKFASFEPADAGWYEWLGIDVSNLREEWKK